MKTVVRTLAPVQSRQLKVAGFQIGYEVFGDPQARPLLLLPVWQIIYSRVWKMQVPYFARFCRVITFDSPGNGGGERTIDPTAYQYDRIVDQGVGLLDHLGVRQADVIGLSNGCAYSLLMAARYPERVGRLVLIGGSVTPTGWPPPNNPAFWERRGTYVGWEKDNAYYWREHYNEWLDFFFSQVFSEPHSTKAIDDATRWAWETTPEILIRTVGDPSRFPSLTSEEIVARIRCPVLLLHGDDDQVCSIEASRSLAAARPDWEFVTLAGSGHAPNVRDPVRVNLIIAEFLRLRH